MQKIGKIKNNVEKIGTKKTEEGTDRMLIYANAVT